MPRLRQTAAVAVILAATTAGTLTLPSGAMAAPTAPPETATPQTAAAPRTAAEEELVVTYENVPQAVTFSPAERGTRLEWQFNQLDVDVVVELTHVATGRKTVLESPWDPDTEFAWVHWSDTYGPHYSTYSGAYTWKMTATPSTGSGPGVQRAGSLTLTLVPDAHDFNDTREPDVLVRDSSGTLSAYDIDELYRMRETECDWIGPCEPPVKDPARTVLGTGWNTYTLMSAPGDLGGTPAEDVVGRDRDGVLWLHRGDKGKLLPRTKVGGGWNVYNKLVGGADLTGDGRGDLLATDTSGALWLYRSTGNTKAPFSARKKIGGGWGIYNLMTGAGNLAGGPGGDLLARDRDGVLWLYLGKGDGTFTARRKVGGGWQKYSYLVPAGANYPGSADLYAIGPSGSALYWGRGSVDRPFSSPQAMPLRTDSTRFKTFF
ncbi:hypothetical protein M5362_05600 [Streptomyces sp. Je 1-79]|uniref:hypothetical protein n=1 Tax=Streptomyces sp. Je 1-79 TaxID=2943847 RepID=UPI0021A6BD9C|nr:hypothetical protein [Streptomyces sp. Je 1-79]MCT4352609.1 hypothetical protein [Streptomyces sp. Je 1-79]